MVRKERLEKLLTKELCNIIGERVLDFNFRK